MSKPPKSRPPKTPRPPKPPIKGNISDEDVDGHVGLIQEKLIGRFVVSWAKLEARMGDAIAMLLGLEFKYGRIITSRLDATGLIKVLREVGELRLPENDFHRLSLLCDKIDIRREDRNLIVHGSWGRILKGNIPHVMSLKLKGGEPDEIISEGFPHKRMQELIHDIRSLHRTLQDLLKLDTYPEKPRDPPSGE